MDITADENNNIYITGRFTGTVDFDPSSNVFNLSSTGASVDIFILKLNSNGDFVWAKKVGGTGDDYGNAIARDTNGDVISTGKFQSTADFDPGTGTHNLVSAGNDEIFILKLNNNGDFVFAKQMGGTGSEGSYDITIDSANNIITTGFIYTGTPDFDPGINTYNLNSQGLLDIFISKLDSNGNFVWAKSIGGSNIEEGYSITVDGQDNVYTTGHFLSALVDFDPSSEVYNLSNSGCSDIFISKLDSNGNFVLGNNLSGTNCERGKSIILDASSHVYVTGFFYGMVDFNPNVATQYINSYEESGDIFVVKFQMFGDTPSLSSITRASSSPTSVASVDFTVTFSEAVQNVDVNDFSLTATGVTGASITSVTPVSALVYTVSVNTGSGNGTIRLDVPNTATIKDLSNNDLSGLPFTTGEVYIIDKNIPLPTGWVGSVSVTSNKNLVSVGRPHIGSEVASYDGFSSGSLTAFVPMLFKDAFGGSYDAALYIQNVSGSSASVTIQYYDSSGVLNCTKADTIAPLASKGYWLPSVSCDSGSLPTGWIGGVKVTSNQNIVAVGRPHIGTEVMTYNGFSSGSTSAYVPMLFKGAFGGSYNAAFYVQNVSGSSASVTLEYFDNTGTLNCTKSDTIASLASKGYWLPAVTCDSGSLPAGWVGGVRVSSSQPVVTVGRPHIDTQITTYDGFSAGSPSSYVPMLFKGSFGGSYNAAFYLQNVSNSSASVTIKYYDNAGTLNCTKSDTIAPLASKGYWVPAATCDTGSLPAGWVGGVEVTSDQPIVSVGRPHIDAQVTTYNGFSTGALNTYLPMLFKDAFGGTYDSAFYLQNTEATAATVTIQFYDSTGALTCSRSDTIQPRATLGFWLPSATCYP